MSMRARDTVMDLEEMPRPSPRSAPRVVLLDDEEEITRAYRRMLPASYEIERTTDGHVALDLIRDNRADVLITDVMMPKVNGLDVVRAAREHDPDLPVILVSTSPTVETAMLALEYGAFRYFCKPVNRGTLEEAVASALAQRERAMERRHALKVAQRVEERQRRHADLAEAFDSALDKLTMAYQPIVSWSKKRVYGYEALVRSSEARLPHPGALFGAAEELDQLRRLSSRIQLIAPRPFAGHAGGELLFANLHPSDLDDEALFDPTSPLAEVAHRTVLELTERASLDTVPRVQERVRALRDLGFRIAIDDIGAGYAGLTSIAAVEPDIVKIDMALVRGIDEKTTSQKLVRSLVNVCRDLGIEVVAEGVETTRERDALLALGCDLLQGYLFARPAPPFIDVNW